MAISPCWPSQAPAFPLSAESQGGPTPLSRLITLTSSKLPPSSHNTSCHLSSVPPQALASALPSACSCSVPSTMAQLPRPGPAQWQLVPEAAPAWEETTISLCAEIPQPLATTPLAHATVGFTGSLSLERSTSGPGVHRK